jgi:hypothetical protein
MKAKTFSLDPFSLQSIDLQPEPLQPSTFGSRFTSHVLRLTPHASRLTFQGILLALLCVAGTSCSTTTPTGITLFEDARGSVSLQTIANPAIQASHPINLEPALLALLLTGLEIHDHGIGPHRRVVEGFAGQPATYPLFSEDQIQFLAPLLAEGLRIATANQTIEYRVVTTREGSNRFQSPTREMTAGSLYAHDRQLYVILSQYRHNPMRTNLDLLDIPYRSQEPLDYSGLRYRTLSFTPKAALRADRPSPPTMEKHPNRFVAIDYQLLDQPSLEAARAAEARARSTEALAQEMEALRQELESIKKQLRDQNQQQK